MLDTVERSRIECAAAASPDELEALKARHLMPCVRHFFGRPPHIVAGEGATLVGHDGRRYIDCLAGVGVMNAGHAQREILDHAMAQMERLQHVTSIFLTEPVLRLAQRLSEIVPVDDARFFFCASGSEAVEFALLTATQATERPLVIAAEDALHGRTRWAMGATGLPMWRSDPFPMDDRIVRVPFNDANAMRRAMRAHAGRVAAVIAEPVQGNGGIHVPDDDYWPRLRELCDRHDVLLIADEVQTGFHRTGPWFACEHWSIRPDIVCMSKGLGNGFPIAAIGVRGEIVRQRTNPSASTYGGNPVSAAAAIATIDVHERLGLDDAACQRGEQLLKGLRRIAARHPVVLGEPRGIGLMQGVPVRQGPSASSAATCDELLENLKDLGVLAGKCGRDRDVLLFMPPLVISEPQVQEALDAVESAACAMSRSR